ncbi:protein YceG like [Desulfurella amilsii]|uniref:Endolytic murein transglycosylase n=1 Tax=Desulfurella amilsii TaxID=1562698 RepID=A0A1X4Y007_9BACT|nr:endolytic transglycosylase MltG [Desulfurella amilsii]OSS43127.1 protein YceG like [Desulfurella amilsii]
MKRVKKLIIINTALLFIALVFIVYAIFSFENFVNQPNSSIKKKIYMVILPSQPVLSISEDLQKKGIIKRYDWFYYYTRLSGKSKDIKAGVHLFYTNYSPKQTLQELIGENKNDVIFSIPPGFDIQTIAQRLSKMGFDGGKFYKLAKSKSNAYELLHFKASNMEGFLGAGDYFVEKKEKPSVLLKLMFEQFKKDYTDLADFGHIDKNLYEKVIIASLVEKEAKVNSERPLIASVICNRLKKNMLLQIDSSVIYGIKDFNGKLTIQDLENKKNIYNTYVHKKLPPTPICSPSYQSLKAAFDPAKTNYLYFVSKNDGRHVFSTTLKQQNYWVDIYQKGKKQ